MTTKTTIETVTLIPGHEIVTFETNLDNWTGVVEEFAADLTDLSWEQSGYRFHLEPTADAINDEDMSYQGWKIRGDGWSPDHEIGTVSAFSWKGETSEVSASSGCDYSRSDSGRFFDLRLRAIEASIRLIANIV